MKFVKRNNFLNLLVRLDNIFGCVSYSNIHVTIRVDKMKECLFLNTTTIIDTIIILNLILFSSTHLKLNAKERLNQKDKYLYKF